MSGLSKFERKSSAVSLAVSQVPQTPSPRRVLSQDYFTPRPRWKNQNRSKAHRKYKTTTDHSDVVYGEDIGDYSGLSGDASEGDTSESDTDLDISNYGVPVTGFAVASNKRNADFHELFPCVPEADYLIEDYGCALQKDILIHGRIYISENHVCFHANIFTWVTNFVIPFEEILTLEKKMTAFVIPNAILISTPSAKYTFASLLARDVTYDILFNIWRLARPDESNIDTPFTTATSEQETPMADGATKLSVQHKETQCACSQSGQHFDVKISDAIFPGTPDRIHNLLFTSGFVKDFMRTSQNLIDIQISDWMPTEPGSELLGRKMSYIKPLSGVVGPKQAKCEIEESSFIDFENYTSMLTTTRTPEVPSGGSFSVKTRTCLTWASAVTTRVVITSQVEWTGRSFIRGIIDRSSIEGQVSYHQELDKALRVYIHENRAEFVPAGMSPAVMEAAEASSASATAAIPQPTVAETVQGKHGHRFLQLAWETTSAAFDVSRKSATGALELLKDLHLWDNLTLTSALYLVIFLLVVSNIYTMRQGSATTAARRRDHERLERDFAHSKLFDKDKWMRDALWDRLLENAHRSPRISVASSGDTVYSPRLHWKDEIVELSSMLDTIEQRVKGLGDRLRMDELE